MKSSSSKGTILPAFLKISLTIAAAAALFAGGLFANVVYSVAPINTTDLAPNAFGQGFVQVNDDGQAVGYGSNSAVSMTQNTTYLGTTTAIPIPILKTSPLQSFQGWAVNDSGVVAGQGYNGSYVTAAEGTASGTTPLPLPAGASSSQAFAISDNGFVAGNASSKPFVYNPNTGTSTTIALPTTGGYISGYGDGVNDSGTVAGLVYNGQYHVYYHILGQPMTLISLPAGWEVPLGTGGQDVAINNSGQVAFYASNTTSGRSAAFIYNPNNNSTTMIALPTGAPSASVGSFAFLNNAGDVVGTANVGPTGQSGWIWNGSQTVLLNSEVPTGWNIDSAVSISNNGIILALGTENGVFNNQEWLELTPLTTPEPSTMLLSAAGLAFVILRRRLRGISRICGNKK